jgi:hypothetical protein
MAKKNAQEPVTETDVDADLDYREKPISQGAPPPPDPEEAGVPADQVDTADDDVIDPDATLSPEEREQKRLSRKPVIDHLSDGVALLDDGTVLPLFDAGDRIVAERHTNCLTGSPWLDTRVYVVRSIDDELGIVHCTDEEMRHYACIGFRNPWTRIKLAPRRGNPFSVSRVEKERLKEQEKEKKKGQVAAPADGEKKKRGRPKGSKNRSKDVIEAEKSAKKAMKKQKKEKKIRGKKVK